MNEPTQVSELGLPEGSTPWIGPNGSVMERLELHLEARAGSVGSGLKRYWFWMKWTVAS